MRPQFLKKGDTIAVISIASAPTDNQLAYNWAKVFEGWGLNVKIGNHLRDKAPGDFAGTDANRAFDLKKMLEDEEVKAIISIRGGYGSMRTIDNIDLNLFKCNPKWLVGFSDITILHAVLNHLQIESIHGAMPGTFDDDYLGISAASLKDALFGKTLSHAFAHTQFNKNGVAHGRLIGGNLTLLRNLIDTPYENDFDKPSILFIEDVSERMYTIDSKLWHLRESGRLAKCNGILVGYFNDTSGEDEWKRSVYELVNEYTAPLSIPVAFGVPCGHLHPNISLYMGREIELNVSDSGTTIIYQ